MEVLDKVLPFYVDYLGRFEYDEEANIFTATDALSELLRSGIQQKLCVRNAYEVYKNSYRIKIIGYFSQRPQL